jgi:putative chitinase
MITGLENYQLLARLTGLPLVEHPELLEDKDNALQCAVLWWEKKVPDSAIDSLERATKAVNGGTIGLADRQKLTQSAGRGLARYGVQVSQSPP